MPLLFILGLILVALLVYVARYSGRLSLRREKLIAAPLSDVFRDIQDFRAWPSWHPWLEHESDPSAVQIPGEPEGAGARCAWRSARAGEYEVTNQRIQAGRSIQQRIAAREPFRFKARIVWEFAEKDGGTLVTWRLKGRVAFALRPFADTVRRALELDARYALDKLAARHGDSGAGTYRIDYVGLQSQPASRHIVKKWEGKMADLRPAIAACAKELRASLAADGLVPGGPLFVAYHRTNIKHGTTACSICLPVAEASTVARTAETPPCDAWVVRLTGDRAALDIAWYQGMQRLRIDDHQPHQGIPPIERYLTDPDSDERPVTELIIPVRPR